jgi:hypothetical protein
VERPGDRRFLTSMRVSPVGGAQGVGQSCRRSAGQALEVVAAHVEIAAGDGLLQRHDEPGRRVVHPRTRRTAVSSSGVTSR